LTHRPTALRTTIGATVVNSPRRQTLLASLLFASPPVAGACVLGIALLVIGLWAARNAIAEARGLDKVVALSNLCFAIPLAVFSAEHLFSAQFILPLVPAYMPWRLFFVYFIGFALIAASLSIATSIGVRWSGLLFGIMMFAFVAMIHFPGAVAAPHDRIVRTIVFREMSFGGAGWLLAATAAGGWRSQIRRALITTGRILIAIAAIVFGVEHFFHPLGLPGVPLEKVTPAWIPGRALIDYVTGAALLAGGVCFLLNRKARAAASGLGSWLLLLVISIYGPVLILALANPAAAIQIEGINYFADTLLFAGGILALASASRERSEMPKPHAQVEAQREVAPEG
jgi:uncharacterized membrane protein